VNSATNATGQLEATAGNAVEVTGPLATLTMSQILIGLAGASGVTVDGGRAELNGVFDSGGVTTHGIEVLHGGKVVADIGTSLTGADDFAVDNWTGTYVLNGALGVRGIEGSQFDQGAPTLYVAGPVAHAAICNAMAFLAQAGGGGGANPMTVNNNLVQAGSAVRATKVAGATALIGCAVLAPGVISLTFGGAPGAGDFVLVELVDF
jgi:hypothetical protein